MKKTILFLSVSLAATTLFAQKLTTTSATIVFDATTSKDALPKAENKTVIAAIDTQTGTIAFEAIMKSFTFSNPTIQEHFNQEKWLNTDLYPTSSFKGKVTNLPNINFQLDGNYPAEVEGELTLHGKTQLVKTTGTIVVEGKKVTASAEFTIKLLDFGVNESAFTSGKVASEPKITVIAELN